MAQWLSNNGATSTPITAGYTLGTKIKVSSDRSPSKIGFKLAARASTIKVSLWDRSTGTRVWTSSPSSVSDGWTWFTVSAITLIAAREYSLSAYVVTTNIDWYAATQDGATWFSSTIEGATYSHQGGYDYASGDTYPNTAVHSGDTLTFTVGLEVGQALTHSAADSLSLSDEGVAGLLLEHTASDSTSLSDQDGGKVVTKTVGNEPPALFGTGVFDLSRFDASDSEFEQVLITDEATAVIIIQHSAADTLSLTDAASRTIARGSQPESVPLTDALVKQARPAAAETTPLSDTLVRQTGKAVADSLTIVEDLSKSQVLGAKTDSVSLADALSKFANRGTQAESISLADVLSKDVTRDTYTEVALALLDSIVHQAQLNKTETLNLLDSITKTIHPQMADTLGLTDTITGRPVKALADTLAVVDAIVKMVAITRNDTGSLSDSVALASALGVKDDTTGLADALTSEPILAPADTASLADSLTQAVAAVKADTLAISDALSVATGIPLSDAISLVDTAALAIAKGEIAEAATGIADVIAASTTLRTADSFGSNLAPPFEKWTLSGGAFVDADGVLHLPSYSASASSPLMPIGGSPNWGWSAEYWSDVAKPSSELGGYLQGSDYYNFQGVAAKNTAGYTGNGNAGTYPVQTWTRKSWSYVAGNGITFLRWRVSMSTTYTASYVKIRLPMASVVGDYGTYKPPLEQADVLVSEAQPKGSDTQALADAVVRAVGKSVSDLMSVADAISKQPAKVLADTLTVTDDIQMAQGFVRVHSDVVSLADNIVKSVSARKPPPALFGEAQFDESYFDGYDGDPVTLSDTLSWLMMRGYLAEDLLALADALATQVSSSKSEITNFVESISKAISKQVVIPQLPMKFDEAIFDTSYFNGYALSEVSPVFEAVALVVAKNPTETILLSDSLLKAVAKQYAESPVATGDAYALLVAKVIAETTGLDEGYTFQMGKAISETLSLAESLIKAVVTSTFDLMSLADVIRSMPTKVFADTLTLNDSIQSVQDFSRVASDDILLADGVIKIPSLLKADSTTLSDVLVQFTTKIGHEPVGVTEALIKAITKIVAEAQLTTAEQFWVQVIKTYNEPVAFLEALIASVHAHLSDTATLTDMAAILTARQVADALGLSDACVRLVGVVEAAIVSVSDQSWADVHAIRQDTLALVEVLAKDTTHPLPADLTGIVDEAALMAMLAKGDLLEQISDVIEGVKRLVMCQAFVEGVSMTTRGLTITKSSKERLSRCTFNILNPSAATRALVKQRANIHAYIVDGSTVSRFGGVVVANPTKAVTPLVDELQVEALDYGIYAQTARVNQIYSGGQKWVDIIKAMWTEAYPLSIDLTAVEDDPRTAPDPWTVNNEWLFDATEAIAELLGWSWYIDWDGSSRILKFFSPKAQMYGTALSVANENIVARTAQFGDDQSIINMVHVLGGEAKSNNFTHSVVADGTQTHFMIPHYAYDLANGSLPTVTVGGVAKVVEEEQEEFPVGVDALLDREQKFYHFSSAGKPAAGQVVSITYRYGYPVHATLWNDESIGLYGRHEHMIHDSNIHDIQQAREVAKAVLRDRAHPKKYGTTQVYETGLEPGMFVQLQIPRRAIDATYEVVEITRSVQVRDITRTVSLNMVDSAESKIADVIKGFAQRLNSLENKGRPTNPFIQRFPYITERMVASASAVVAGAIDYTFATALTMAESHIRTLIAAGLSTSFAIEFATELEDAAVTMAVKVGADTGATADIVQVGMALFDSAKFDAGLFGERVASS